MAEKNNSMVVWPEVDESTAFLPVELFSDGTVSCE